MLAAEFVLLGKSESESEKLLVPTGHKMRKLLMLTSDREFKMLWKIAFLVRQKKKKKN